MSNELLMLLMKEREEKHFERDKNNQRAIGEIFTAIEVMTRTIEYGICPATAKHPIVVNSISSLRSLDDPVKLGQRIIVLIGGCNGQELHEVSKIDAQGRVVETSVIDGFSAFQVQKTHSVRNLDNF